MDARDAMIRHQRNADAREFAKERIQHVARAVRIRKELTVRFNVERNAEILEERNRVVGGEPPQDAPYDCARSAGEVGLGHDGVRDVAARAAADQDLGSGLPRALEDEDGERRCVALGEDRRGKAGGSAADDGNIT